MAQYYKTDQYHKMDREHRAKQFAPFDALSGFDRHLRNAEAKEYALPPNQEKISLIASISTIGKMIPLWYSYHGMKFKIEHVIWSLEKDDWNQYRCEIHDNQIKKIVDLFYYKEITLWTIS